jgi:hypothetical protein
MPRADFNEAHALKLANCDSDVPWASAKSMYRLCDSVYTVSDEVLPQCSQTIMPGLGAQDIVVAAKSHIMGSLTPANVVDEVTSTFAQRYPDIVGL